MNFLGAADSKANEHAETLSLQLDSGSAKPHTMHKHTSSAPAKLLLTETVSPTSSTKMLLSGSTTTSPSSEDTAVMVPPESQRNQGAIPKRRPHRSSSTPEG